MRAKLAGALLVAVVLAALVAPASAQANKSTVLADIRQESTDRSTRLAVECTGPVVYSYYSPDPLTLVVDIPEADASKLPSRINVGTREVESLRITSMARGDGRSLARLEVRLASLVPYQIYSKDRTLNLVFERPVEVASSQAASPKAAEPKPETAAQLAEPRAEPTAQHQSQTASPAQARSEAIARAESGPEATTAVAEPSASTKPSAAPEAVRRAPSPVKPAAPARRILSVSQEAEAGQLAILVRGDGAFKYQDFFVGNPDRLVVDFKDVVSRAPVRSLEVNQGPVRKARLAQFSAASPKVARLVLDLNTRAPYRIVEGKDGVKIVFGEGVTPSPAPLAALRSELEPAGGVSAAPPSSGAPAASVPVTASAPPPVSETAAVSDASTATVSQAGEAAAASGSPSGPAPAQVLPAPALPEPVLPDPQVVIPKQEFEAKTLGEGQKLYTGHPISLDFKDGDLQDIFRLFADISGLNVVVNPGVSGKVTLKLTEVPWDQALDLILKTNGLGYTLEDNVIRIAKLTDLQREEQERRKLAEEKALAGDLQVFQKSLSYAKAAELEGLIKKVALSPRGTITLDPRTNTMIITDLPANLERARQLIVDLDRATPQVEIEARVVVTSRTFLRDLGIQWGFLNQQTPQFGNTTNQAFPNAIILNGQGVAAAQGLSPDQGGLASIAGIGVSTPPRGYAVNLPAASFNTALGITAGNIIGSFNIDAALTAIESQGRGRVLSTPKVTTQNNQQAEIEQGIKIPFPITTGQGNISTTSVQFEKAVLNLKVTPQITEAGTVILGLELKNDQVDFSRLVDGRPAITIQFAKTSVLVHDGQTAVVGGVYQSTEQTARRSTPYLADVPILGYLFRSRQVRNENQELLLFITPRIVKG